jgi:phosphoglycerate dehydrogenase-like enzyme
MLPKVVMVYPLVAVVGEQMLEEKTQLVRPKGQDEASISAALEDAVAIVLRGPAQLTARMIERAPKLKVIAAQGAGTDNIDVAAATRRGIPVVYGAGIAPDAVAEYVIGAAVIAHRQFQKAHREFTTGLVDWGTRMRDLKGFELTGTTFGVIGFGNIGRSVAKKARGAFNCEILAYDPLLPPGTGKEFGRLVSDLDELLDKSSTVSINAPLTPETRGMLKRAQLKRIGPDGVLIDAARGGVVHEADLIAALNAGELKGAVMDVFDPEPPSNEQVARLAAARNTILTPHIAGVTDQSQIALAKNVAQGVLDVLAGRRPSQVLNKEVLN